MNRSFLTSRLVDGGFLAGLVLALIVVSVIDRTIGPTTQTSGGRQAGTGYGLLHPKSPFDLRVADKKEEWIGQVGGTKESEEAVEKGLDWLARHQGRDGAWRTRDLKNTEPGLCERHGKACGPDGGGGFLSFLSGNDSGNDYPFAQTGLALLAFQAAGHFEFNDKSQSPLVRKGLDWLVEHQGSDGALCRAQDAHYMYEHGIAAFALAESCAAAAGLQQKPNPKYLRAAQRAVAFIEDQQHDDGGWRYTSSRSEPSDTSISGWQVLALKSAREGGIPIKDECVRKVREFFRTCETGENGRTGYQRSSRLITEATTGVGMLVHQFLLNEPECDLVKKAAYHLANHIEATKGRTQSPTYDYYLWYNCTLAMHTAGGPEWDRWNAVMRDLVVRKQEPQSAGCRRGSWPHVDDGGPGGRIYSTALAVLTLEVYYRFAKVEEHQPEDIPRKESNH